MLKKIFATALVFIMAFGFSGCGEKYKLPEYSQKEFSIGGNIAPYETNEKTLTQYKNAGFNTLYFGSHDTRVLTSETQYYLGSERTMKTLELCKKVGLNAVLAHNIWYAEGIEGEDYLTDKPFSNHDVYGEYKDIITGIHIWDEPQKDDIPTISDKAQIEDFKKTYPNADYMVNLIPITANATGWGYTTYEEMLDIYCDEIMSQFESPYISLDIYPFHLQAKDTHLYYATNLELIAKRAKEHNAKANIYLQSSTGNEFEKELTEGDMRWQINSSIAFGFESLLYYCYSVPRIAQEDGSISYMYDYCVLNQDDTPSKLYYYIQDIHKEIQSYASVILSYDWDMSYGVLGEKTSDFRVGEQSMHEDIFNSKHFTEAHASHDLLINRFVSDEYGEAYMLVNFADNATNKINVSFKDCRAVAVYGGKGFEGTPEIVELDENGVFTRELPYGDGVFVTPLV